MIKTLRLLFRDLFQITKYNIILKSSSFEKYDKISNLNIFICNKSCVRDAWSRIRSKEKFLNRKALLSDHEITYASP